MKYDPKDINASLIPDKTETEFKIQVASDEVSKTSGKPMMKLTVTLWDSEGNERNVWEYITSKSLFKLEQLCKIKGLDFESGDITAEDLIGIEGRCVVGISKDQTGQYADKNSVRKFIHEASEPSRIAPAPQVVAPTINTKFSAALAKTDSAPAIADDDIPF